MASTRAADVAEVLWELKRADKLATFTNIAGRAGFSAGTGGRALKTALRTVRRDWPHLQWWRAMPDDGQLEKGSEHENQLTEAGYEIEAVDNETVSIKAIEEKLMTWSEGAENEAEEAEA